MRVHIFDVEHGECNIIQTPTGHMIMIGAGHNSSSNWRPSNWMIKNNLKLTSVVLNHLDEDHLSDLPNFELYLRPTHITRNFDLNHTHIASQKAVEGGLGKGVRTAAHWADSVYTGARVPFDYGIEVQYFYHPPSKFQDTNNLSVVTFVAYEGLGIMFPGDLEKAGWEAFLGNPSFVNCLQRTNVFVASHHGRENGYAESIFGQKLCQPDLVVISDKALEHETQMHDSYAKHANGVPFPEGVRKALTTRKDGKITINVNAQGKFININQPY